MNLDAAGLTFIFQFEGFVPFLYDDGPYGKGNATVAIGILVHTGPYHWDRGVCAKCDEWPRQYDPESAWVTEELGQAMLWDKANATGRFVGGQDYVGAVRAHFPRVNQNQFNAVASFAYNLGTGYLRNVAAVYYSGGDVCAELMKYVLPEWARAGLTRRRSAECVLFKGPWEDEMTEEQLARLENLEKQAYTARRDLNELANGQEYVIKHNDVDDVYPKLSLKGLWYIAGKAWPF